MDPRADPGRNPHRRTRPVRLLPAAVLHAVAGPRGRGLFDLCAANGISQIVWSPLAQGVLTGKYKPGRPVPEGSRFASADMAVSQDLVYSDAILEAVQRLVPIAEEAGMSMPTLALARVLRRREVASAITGASRPEQVHANAAASGLELSDDLLTAIDQALGCVPVTEPTLAPAAQAGVKHRGGLGLHPYFAQPEVQQADAEHGILTQGSQPAQRT
ncbi:aldo/keto reductase [Streptomyces sp. NPDC014995]|uniref:aldo/keto reductase n=1 Tax=Streptomyces sp. NPDC014995 TaxID=3364936 RepID=UPI0036FE0E58